MAMAPQADSGVIAGVVMTTDSPPQLARRAIVCLHGGNSRLGRHAVTDDEGRFVFQSLPAGRYTLSAAKRSFVTIPFGALRAGQPGAPLILAAGQRIEDAQLKLARGAVITGSVRDAENEPLTNLDVRVEATTAVGTTRAFLAQTKTDDQGVYRIFELPAGSYVISARPSSSARGDMVAPTDAEIDAALKELRSRPAASAGPIAGSPAIRNVPSRAPARPVDFVRVFHPSVFDAADAGVVTVGAGEERAGVDVVVRLLETAAVSGRVLNLGNRPPSEVEITLNKTGQTGMQGGATRTIARADGTFRLAGVTPGRYLVSARAMTSALFSASYGKPDALAPADFASCATATQELQLIGDDANDVSLTLRPCLKIEGHVRFITSDPAAPALAQPGVTITFQPATETKRPMYMPIRLPAVPDANGRFVLGQFGDVLPGAYHLVVNLPEQAGRGWRLESGTANGQDVLDRPLVIGSDAASPISLDLTFTDRDTSLSGTIEVALPRLAVEYTVVVFPTNRDWWSLPYRRVKAARAAANGQFVIHDLPAGEYFMAALSDLAPDEWRDREFLSLIAPVAMRVTIAPGEQKIQNFKIARQTAAITR